MNQQQDAAVEIHDNKQLEQLALGCLPQHRKLAKVYVDNGCNRQAKMIAAKECGYSVCHQVIDNITKILSRPEVLAYVRQLMHEKAKLDDLDPNWVKKGLMFEATYMGKGASHGGRVAAHAHLARILKMLDGEQASVTVPVKIFVGIDPDQV